MGITDAWHALWGENKKPEEPEKPAGGSALAAIDNWGSGFLGEIFDGSPEGAILGLILLVGGMCLAGSEAGKKFLGSMFGGGDEGKDGATDDKSANAADDVDIKKLSAALGPEYINKLQEKLGLPQTGELDADTIKKIKMSVAADKQTDMLSKAFVAMTGHYDGTLNRKELLDIIAMAKAHQKDAGILQDLIDKLQAFADASANSAPDKTAPAMRISIRESENASMRAMAKEGNDLDDMLAMAKRANKGQAPLATPAPAPAAMAAASEVRKGSDARGAATVPTPAPIIAKAPHADVCITALKTLAPGAKGVDVKALQDLLGVSESKFVSRGKNGIQVANFGDKTEAALVDFQSRHGIKATGLVDADTLKYIKEMPASDIPGKTLGLFGPDVKAEIKAMLADLAPCGVDVAPAAAGMPVSLGPKTLVHS